MDGWIGGVCIFSSFPFDLLVGRRGIGVSAFFSSFVNDRKGVSV